MRAVYAEIELINGNDLAFIRRGFMNNDEVKHARVNMLVDTRSTMLFINEHIQEQLQLPVWGTRQAQLSNGQIVTCKVVGPVELKFKNRDAICRALVLPGNSVPILGLIPFQEMDVRIDLQKHELIVNPDNPDFALMKLKKQLLAPTP